MPKLDFSKVGKKGTALPVTTTKRSDQPKATKKPVKAPIAESRPEKVIVYLTVEEKRQLNEMRGLASASSFLHPTIKEFITRCHHES